MRPAKKPIPVRPTAKSRSRSRPARPNGPRPCCRRCVPSCVTTSPTPTVRRLHADFCTFFRECLTPWLNYYTAIDGLLTDAIDLETAVFYGVPDRLSRWLIELLAGRPADSYSLCL